MSQPLPPPPGGIDDGDAIAPGVVLPAGALAFTYSRSGGPGGQNVNKLNTRCTMTLQLSDLAPVVPDDALRRLRTLAGSRLARGPERLVITSDVSRSQHANRRACVEKLRELVVASLRQLKTRRATRPTKAAKRRRLDTKRRRGTIKSLRRGGQDAGE